MSDGRRVVALGGLTLGTFAYVTTETMPIGLLEPMARDLDASTSAIGLLVTLYALVVVVSGVPLTALTRRVPRRPLLSGLLGLYVVASVGTALSGSWWTALAARAVTAADQALFWSIVVPVAAGLFEPAVRGRVIAVVLSGSSLAAVAGVPLGTWVGQQVGWRWTFVALGAVGVVVLALVVALPAGTSNHATAQGSAPDRRRFWVLVVATALATTGTFAFFTYVSPFLTDVAGVTAAALGLVLVGRGLAGVGGIVVAGALTDAHPRAAIALPVGLQVGALVSLAAWPQARVLTVVAVAVTGFTFAAFTAPMASRTMVLAPGTVDVAVSIVSTAVNVGIMLGALLGGVVVDLATPRGTAWLGAALTAVALGVLVLDRPSRPTPGPHASRPDAGGRVGAP